MCTSHSEDTGLLQQPPHFISQHWLCTYPEAPLHSTLTAVIKKADHSSRTFTGYVILHKSRHPRPFTHFLCECVCVTVGAPPPLLTDAVVSTLQVTLDLKKKNLFSGFICFEAAVLYLLFALSHLDLGREK